MLQQPQSKINAAARHKLSTLARRLLILLFFIYITSSIFGNLLLKRVLKEQAVEQEDGTFRLRTKEDGGMNAEILQNPSDPEATFREKAGKQNRGYSANITESAGEKGSIVTDYQFEANTHSDSGFLKESVTGMGHQEKETILITDGAFASEENTALAKENNITLITTNLTPI